MLKLLRHSWIHAISQPKSRLSACGIAADGAYLRRAESSNLHILSLVHKESISAIDAQIWKAQLQVLFPLLEIERVSFIKRYRKQVQEALGEKYHDFRTGRSQYIYQFGETG